MASKETPRSPRLSAADLTDQRRDEIYHAAVSVFAEHGYRDATIAKIAAVMGAGHGTIYRYFSNKQAIVEYVIQRAVMQLMPVIEAEPADATTTLEEYREQVGRIGRSLFEVFMRDPELGRVLFFVVGEVGSDLREQVAKAFDYFTLGTELYLKNGIERGFINPKIDTFATAAALNLLIFEGARRLEFADDPSAETDRWIATAQMLLFDGISAERRSGR